MAAPDILSALREILPADSVLLSEEERTPYECDALTAFGSCRGSWRCPARKHRCTACCAPAAATACPWSRAARARGSPAAPRRMPAGVLLSLARMHRILEVDPLARTARVEPGVRNLKVSEAAAAHGLYYAPDPSSQVACSIGGNVAENSGGVHCLKYGLTVHNVLGVRGYAIDGERLEFGGAALGRAGTRSAGAHDRLGGPAPGGHRSDREAHPATRRCAQLVMACFTDVHSAGDAVAAVIGAGIIPAALEMMDRKATAAVEPFVHAGYDLAAAAILLVESDGTRRGGRRTGERGRARSARLRRKLAARLRLGG